MIPLRPSPADIVAELGKAQTYRRGTGDSKHEIEVTHLEATDDYIRIKTSNRRSEQRGEDGCTHPFRRLSGAIENIAETKESKEGPDAAQIVCANLQHVRVLAEYSDPQVRKAGHGKSDQFCQGPGRQHTNRGRPYSSFYFTGAEKLASLVLGVAEEKINVVCEFLG